jgi:hypothetical protein
MEPPSPGFGVWATASCVKNFSQIVEGVSYGKVNTFVGAVISVSPQSQFETKRRPMANTHVLFDERPTYSPQRISTGSVRKLKYNRLYPNAPPTDIIEWLTDNEPQHFGELMDLRRALYSRSSHGRYRIRHAGHTLAGEEKFVVTGPAGPLLIVSNKSRHYLLRTLCRLRRERGWPPMTR